MPHVEDKMRPDLGGNIRHGDIYTWCPLLWKFLVERYAIKSVLDVGCGEGHAVLYFNRLGVYAHGIDGLPANIQRSVTPIALHDLLTGPYIMPVDMVWSCEVAEHILPAKVDNYLETLTNGRVVAMTHALPGQTGHHHVNCQPKEYWVSLMSQRGFVLADDNDVIIDISRKDQVPHTYFSRTGLIFLRS